MGGCLVDGLSCLPLGGSELMNCRFPGRGLFHALTLIAGLLLSV